MKKVFKKSLGILLLAVLITTGIFTHASASSVAPSNTSISTNSGEYGTFAVSRYVEVRQYVSSGLPASKYYYNRNGYSGWLTVKQFDGNYVVYGGYVYCSGTCVAP
ncbi:hypothetical protein [Salirhabdus sp. Marseille-P4669]|uniref:hypothetical protein n=1 Tax=Salirhabdus sp. Marseille-P4669 TaxID=2042310 RepID=UPI000C7BB54D|nr:hypothetical protein [Salirhabdus sp. Marseille-P4669]